MTDRRDEDDERKRAEGSERRELEAAGWEAKGRGTKAIWRAPTGGRWYAHYQALEAMHGAKEERLLGEHGFERAPTEGRERWVRREEGEELYSRPRALEKVREEE
jgi:hypothetical protein